jgi:hypothetical protein
MDVHVQTCRSGVASYIAVYFSLSPEMYEYDWIIPKNHPENGCGSSQDLTNLALVMTSANKIIFRLTLKVHSIDLPGKLYH